MALRRFCLVSSVVFCCFNLISHQLKNQAILTSRPQPSSISHFQLLLEILFLQDLCSLMVMKRLSRAPAVLLGPVISWFSQTPPALLLYATSLVLSAFGSVSPAFESWREGRQSSGGRKQGDNHAAPPSNPGSSICWMIVDKLPCLSKF